MFVSKLWPSVKNLHIKRNFHMSSRSIDWSSTNSFYKNKSIKFDLCKRNDEHWFHSKFLHIHSLFCTFISCFAFYFFVKLKSIDWCWSIKSNCAQKFIWIPQLMSWHGMQDFRPTDRLNKNKAAYAPMSRLHGIRSYVVSIWNKIDW